MDLLYRIVDQVLAGDPQILLLFLTFSSVMLLVLGGVGLVGARDRVAQRLQEGAKASPGMSKRKVTLRVGEHESLLHRLFRPLYQYVVPKDQKRHAVLRQRLMQAGYFGPSAMHFYFTVRVCLAVALPVLTAFTLPLVSRDIELQSLLLMIVGAALGGKNGWSRPGRCPGPGGTAPAGRRQSQPRNVKKESYASRGRT